MTLTDIDDHTDAVGTISEMSVDTSARKGGSGDTRRPPQIAAKVLDEFVEAVNAALLQRRQAKGELLGLLAEAACEAQCALTVHRKLRCAGDEEAAVSVRAGGVP